MAASQHMSQPPMAASTWSPQRGMRHSAVTNRQLAMVHRRAHGTDQQQPLAAAGFVQELGVTYRHNDILQGLSLNGTAEACAAACRTSHSARCIAWSWLPASSAALPSACRLKSARGMIIESSPGAVSGYLQGAALICMIGLLCHHGVCLLACLPASVFASRTPPMALQPRAHDYSTCCTHHRYRTLQVGGAYKFPWAYHCQCHGAQRGRLCHGLHSFPGQ